MKHIFILTCISNVNKVELLRRWNLILVKKKKILYGNLLLTFKHYWSLMVISRKGHFKNNNHDQHLRQELRVHMALVTRPEELRAKSSYRMSSNKILRINRLI